GGADEESTMRRLMILVVGALCAAAAAAGTAGAQVAIGPPLNVAPTTAEGCEFGILPPLRSPQTVPPNCTLFPAETQVPRGNWRLTAVNIRTGPRTGPMRVQIIQALRSQAQAPGTPNASGAICCTSPAQSQVFTLPPNTISTVPVNLPVVNTVQLVDGEPIEVVDYIGLTLLDLNSSLPIAQGQGVFASLFFPALQQGGQLLLGPSFQARPLISATVCPVGAGAQEFTSHQAGGCPPTGPGGPPAGPGSPPSSPGSSFACTLPDRPSRLSLATTVSQLRINQRIAVAAVRRLNSIAARLDGRPEPVASDKEAGEIRATTVQLRINQRISEAGYRRAKAIYDRLGGSGSTALRPLASTIRLTRAGVGANQLTNIRALDMLNCINRNLE
ncbi:MAG: hypothetical protein RIB67_02955, partial [Miltoncostaeaceae bacterium]